MQATPNYALPLYELDDAANLADGYNNAMGKIDTALNGIEGKFPITGAEIEDGSITTADLANGSVTTNKLATAAVTDDKLAIGAVTAPAIEDNAVTTPAIEDLSVTNDKIANGTLGLEKFSPEALENIVPGADSITTEMLKDGAVTRPKISNDAFDAEPTENSDNLLTSGAVYEALGGVELETDDTPTANSTNLVTSGGVYAADQKLSQDISDNSQFGDYAFQSVTGSTSNPIGGVLTYGTLALGLSPNRQYFILYGAGQRVAGSLANKTLLPGETSTYGIPTALYFPSSVVIENNRIISGAGYSTINKPDAVQGETIQALYMSAIAIGTDNQLYVDVNTSPTFGQADRNRTLLYTQNIYILNSKGYIPIIDEEDSSTFNLNKRPPVIFDERDM